LILDQLSHCDFYRRLSDHFAAGFDYLRQTDLAKIPDGRYAIRGDDVLAIVQSYTTRPIEQGRWEAHRRNADIQLVIAGRERMGVAPLERMKTQQPYEAASDLEFFTDDSRAGQFVLVEQGSFAIFLPQDVHMPSMAIDGGALAPVKKVVVKVRVA
jgi:YhcH/YjgK/YiaL family protein